MTTKVKSSQSSKTARKSVKNAAVAAGVSSASVAAITAAAVAGDSSHAVSVAVGAGLAAPAAVAGLRSSAVAASMDEDIKLSAFRSKIVSRWSAPRFEDSEDYKMMSSLLASAPADLRDRSLNGARLAWLARPENAASIPSVSDVCDYISNNFASEFKTLCGCSVPAAGAVRDYSYSNLSVSTITADSDINDYFYSAAVPAGASASSVVTAVMSVRVLVDIKRRFAAARAAARSEFKGYMAGAARRSLRLGLSASVAARYFSFLLNAVPAADDRDVKRLRKNLAACWSALRTCENNIMLAAPAGFWGAAAPIPDNNGGFCFPASLPAVPAAGAASTGVAKVRKLWAKRVGLLSSIGTLNGLLRAAGAA